MPEEESYLKNYSGVILFGPKTELFEAEEPSDKVGLVAYTASQ